MPGSLLAAATAVFAINEVAITIDSKTTRGELICPIPSFDSLSFGAGHGPVLAGRLRASRYWSVSPDSFRMISRVVFLPPDSAVTS